MLPRKKKVRQAFLYLLWKRKEKNRHRQTNEWIRLAKRDLFLRVRDSENNNHCIYTDRISNELPAADPLRDLFFL